MAYGNYMYKIQWLFQQPASAMKVVRALGAKSLDIIYFRDMNMKIIDSYNSMVQYPYGVADEKAVKAIQKITKGNPNIYYIELLRN